MSFSVTDVDGNPNVVPAGTVVTVVGLSVEVPPLVVVSPVAAGVVGQPITVSPIVIITDLDSDIESATVTIVDPAEGDVPSWGGLPQGVSTVGFDAESGTVTFTGVASAQVYQQLLQSVMLTSTAAGLKSVSFSVTDVAGVSTASAVGHVDLDCGGVEVGEFFGH
ncbi:hypothetical protein [Mycolicibacterium gilvum]|uniref:hypothetical protein n=1 Tax=Mycolicibacterium gilvum TaxID=1804 RepID=UPI0021F36A00|nr:hypothetical protein [Mycolicibacterium gilvum]MCV7057874.1 hypothetical protein [Mycolicibacterium gilvum]